MKRTSSQARMNERVTSGKRRRLTKQPSVSAIVKREIARQSDHKYSQQQAASQSIDYSGTMINLTSVITRGDGPQQFDGSSITPTHIRLSYLWNIATTSAFNNVRTIVFQWFDNSIPTPTLILATVGNALAPLSPTTIETKPLFKVLADNTDVINASYSGANTALTRIRFIPAKKLKIIKFPASGVTPPIYGGLFLLAISDDAITDFPDFSYTCEIAFID